MFAFLALLSDNNRLHGEQQVTVATIQGSNKIAGLQTCPLLFRPVEHAGTHGIEMVVSISDEHLYSTEAISIFGHQRLHYELGHLVEDGCGVV